MKSLVAVLVSLTPAFATTYQAPSCGVNQEFAELCVQHAFAVGRLGLSSQNVPPNQPAVYQSATDRPSDSGSLKTFAFNPVLGTVLTASASGNFSAGFGTSRFRLDGEGTYTTTGQIGSSGFVSMFIQDYFLFTNRVAPGTQWDFRFGYTATGQTYNTGALDENKPYYAAQTQLSFGIPGANGSCTNGGASTLHGTFSTVCDFRFLASPLSVVPVSSTILGFLDVVNESDTLDASHTFRVDYAGLIDAAGNPVNSTIYDASGFNYNQTASTTPEPGTALLVMPLLLGYVVRKRYWKIEPVAANT